MRPRDGREPHITSNPTNNSLLPIFCNYRHISSSMGEGGGMEPRAASYDPVRAPGIHAFPRPLPKLINHDAETCNNRLLSHDVTKNLSPEVSPHTDNRHLKGTPHERKPEDEMRSSDKEQPGDIPQFLDDKTHISPQRTPGVEPECGRTPNARGRETERGARGMSDRRTARVASH